MQKKGLIIEIKPFLYNCEYETRGVIFKKDI